MTVSSSDNTKLRLVVYGSSKVGKSTLAMTFPRPIFVINSDEGLEGDVVAGLTEGVDYVERRPSTYKDLEDYYRELKGGKFATVVFDSITVQGVILLNELHDMGMAASTAQGKATLPVMRWTPEIQEYGAASRQAFRILVDYRRLGLHMAITAQRRDQMGRHLPDVIPSVMNVLSHFCNVIGELEVVTHDKGKELDRPVRVLWTMPRSDREAGSRFRALTPRVVNPTFDKMWSAITNGTTKQGETK